MPTENDSPVLEYELCAKDGAEWKPIGKISEVSAITFADDEERIIPTWEKDDVFTVKIKSIQGEISKKSIRWFRKNLGLDLLPMMFPKKKNRRKKRLWRNAQKVFRSF